MEIISSRPPRSKKYIRPDDLAENNNWSNKVLQARHDKLLDYVYMLWADFVKYQNLVQEYRETGKIQEIEVENRIGRHPRQLGYSLLEDVFLPSLPTKDSDLSDIEGVQ
jgi:hypothetical protein